MKQKGKVLRKSRTDYVLRGTLGGVAEYLGWSSFKVRLVFVVLTLCTAAFPGVIAYIVLTILMPEPESGGEFRLEDYRKQ